MLLHTSRQGRGYVELREPTGKPVEGRLVDAVLTKTSGWEKREASISQEGTITGNNRVACVIGSSFNSSLVGLWCVQGVYIGYTEKSEYVIAECCCSYQSGIIRVWVNLRLVRIVLVGRSAVLFIARALPCAVHAPPGEGAFDNWPYAAPSCLKMVIGYV